MIAGLEPAYRHTRDIIIYGRTGMPFGYYITLSIDFFGALVVIIVGFLTRPYGFRVALCAIGFLYIALFYGYFPQLIKFKEWITMFIVLSPGIACIISGAVAFGFRRFKRLTG